MPKSRAHREEVQNRPRRNTVTEGERAKRAIPRERQRFQRAQNTLVLASSPDPSGPGKIAPKKHPAYAAQNRAYSRMGKLAKAAKSKDRGF